MPRVYIDPKYVDLAKKNGIGEGTFRSRVNGRGWSPEKAATTPIQKAGNVYGKWNKGNEEKTDDEIDYARRKEVPIDVQRSSQRGVKIEYWSDEKIEAHLATIGPDKNFESAQLKGSKVDIIASQEKRNANGHYEKKGGNW